MVRSSPGGELSWWGFIRVGVVQWGVVLDLQEHGSPHL